VAGLAGVLRGPAGSWGPGAGGPACPALTSDGPQPRGVRQGRHQASRTRWPLPRALGTWVPRGTWSATAAGTRVNSQNPQLRYPRPTRKTTPIQNSVYTPSWVPGYLAVPGQPLLRVPVSIPRNLLSSSDQEHCPHLE
jgi:hypothetical protein